MRILVLSWNFPPTLGGIEYVVGNLFRGLLDLGHDVDVVTTAGKGEAEARVHRASAGGLAKYVWFALCEGARQCRRARPDIIVCGSVVPAPAAYFLSLRFRCPYLVLAHGSDVLHPGFIYQRVIRFLFRRAGRLTANSSPTRDLLVEAGVPADRVDVVFPGVRTNDFVTEPAQGAEALLEKLEGRRVLLSVGRLIKRKGLLEFVREVLPGLVKDFPDVALVIVGGDATRSLVHSERMRDQIENAANELGLADHVFLTGELPDDDVVRLYFRSDVFILPCLDIPGDVEGFGIVFLEAALAGTPSVATRVGGIPDAVADGESGLLVTPSDFPALQGAVSRLLGDEALRARLAAAGAERARNSFSWPEITRQYEAAFRRCCGMEQES